MLGTLKKPLRNKSSNTYSLALSDKFLISIGLKVLDETFANSWVLDSSATNHMTHSSHQFNNYNPCPSSRKKATVNGSLTTIAGARDVHISPTLTLRNVLHIAKLSTNLVSIQKLTQDLGCNVTFYPTHCVFQDQGLEKMIGLAEERIRLYYLEISSESSLSFLSKHDLVNKEKI